MEYDKKTDVNSVPTSMPAGVREVRIAVGGHESSGKSTLVAVLSKCVKDNGAGEARQLVLHHKHEKQSGVTSSITNQIMGFNGENQNEPLNEKNKESWPILVKKSDKIISFIDLCGQERFLHTTVLGMTGEIPDYIIITVSAQLGILQMTTDHLTLAMSLKIPVIIVVTFMDKASEEETKTVVETLEKVMKMSSINREVVVLEENTDMKEFHNKIYNNRFCPIFKVSNVSGEGIAKLKLFLSRLISRVEIIPSFKSEKDNIEFLIDDVFDDVTDKKVSKFVCEGILLSGRVKVGDKCMIGPDNKGNFTEVKITSIQYKRSDVFEICRGNKCSLGIFFDKKSDLRLGRRNWRKGTVILGKATENKCVYEFEAELNMIKHTVKIKPRFQALFYCGMIRQGVHVVSTNEEMLETGEKGVVRLRFAKLPEFLTVGSQFILREGRLKGIGKVTKLIMNDVAK